VASGSSGHTAGAGLIPGIGPAFLTGLAPRIKSTVSSRVVPQRECDVPVAYEATMASMISTRTRSSTLCIVVGLIGNVWCESGVRGCVCA
jgi:hypothetical protein